MSINLEKPLAAVTSLATCSETFILPGEAVTLGFYWAYWAVMVSVLFLMLSRAPFIITSSTRVQRHESVTNICSAWMLAALELGLPGRVELRLLIVRTRRKGT